MRNIIILSLLAAFALSGCVAGQSLMGYGLIYSHTRQPLMLNTNATKVSDGDNSRGSVLELQMQPWVHVAWKSNAIGDIARTTGIDVVYFADLEELRILGIWATHTVHIYGVSDGEPVHMKVSRKSIDKEPVENP